MTETEVNRAFDAKVRRGIFAPVARFLRNSSTAEDQLQDAVAQTWLMYRRYALEKDRVLDDGVLVHSCRQRAVDLRRRFVGKNGATCRNRDVLDPRAYRDGRVEVLRFDGMCDAQSAECDHEIPIGYAEALAANPARKIRSAIDLRRWLGQLCHRDRCILERRMAGYPLGQIAAELGMSTSSVFARAKALGLELAARAGVCVRLDRERRGRRPARAPLAVG